MYTLTLKQIEEYVLGGKILEIDLELKHKIQASFQFLQEFSSDKIIYGINTGFGPMAQFKVDKDKLNQLQFNLIRSHSSGLGNTLDDESARAVILARIANFLQANSGVSFPVIEQLVTFFNLKITPEIFEHGGVGASGDLVQLAHLALNLIGEGNVRFENEKRKTADVFSALEIPALPLQLRDGLALMNGTSCMSGIAAINLIYAKRLLNWSIAGSSILNEVLEAYDDSFSHGLNDAKRHVGQKNIAQQMRDFLSGSKLIQKREELFANQEAIHQTEFQKKIQEYYSIRCVPQILGPILDTIEYAEKIVVDEFNSTNDNPIISEAENTVYHGGNFHGDYISLEMDKLKIVLCKLSMLTERQLNFLLNPNLNKQFPAFLNAKTLGFNFGLQGIQFTATSTTAENQMLSNPMYVHSIPNNNDNQDIVSMGTNSALVCKKVCENSFQVMAIQLLALAQAIDLLPLHKKEKLAPKTLQVHQLVREVIPFIEEDLVQNERIQSLIDKIKQINIL